MSGGTRSLAVWQRLFLAAGWIYLFVLCGRHSDVAEFGADQWLALIGAVVVTWLCCTFPAGRESTGPQGPSPWPMLFGVVATLALGLLVVAVIMKSIQGLNEGTETWDSLLLDWWDLFFS